MKIIILSLIMIFSPIAYGQSLFFQNSNDLNCFLKLHFINYSKITGFSVLMLERKGCCSWHNGVCGCSNGRARCCDGSLSPTCGC